MTLIVAYKRQDDIVIAADTFSFYWSEVTEETNKIIELKDNVYFARTGLTIVKELVKDYKNEITFPLENRFDVRNLYLWIRNHLKDFKWKLEESENWHLTWWHFMLITWDKIFLCFQSWDVYEKDRCCLWLSCEYSDGILDTMWDDVDLEKLFTLSNKKFPEIGTRFNLITVKK